MAGLSDGLSAEEVIQALGLVPLPGEGGYFRETYRSVARLASPSLADRFPPMATDQGVATRSLATAIYYFLTEDTYSAMHRLRSDETYHFYRGDPVELFLWDETSLPRRVVLGSRWELGETCQCVVPAGVWQGSRLVEGGKWALMGTTVSPGFEFMDFELLDKRLLDRPGADPSIRNDLDSLLAG